MSGSSKMYKLPLCPVLLINLSFALSGCGESWEAETHSAGGTISINGEAPVGAIVELQNVAAKAADVRNSRPWGVVDEFGIYTLTTYQSNDGAPKGEYAITVRWPPTVNQPSLADRLQKAYSNPKTSKWRVTIEEGHNELSPVTITGAKVTPAEKAVNRRAPPMGPGMGGR